MHDGVPPLPPIFRRRLRRGGAPSLFAPAAAGESDYHQTRCPPASPGNQRIALNLDHWLGAIGLGQYAELFRSNDIDWVLLPRLTADDLKDMGVVSVGHRTKLLEAIAALAAVPVAATATQVSPVLSAPEHYTPKHLAEKILLSRSAFVRCSTSAPISSDC